MSVRDRLGINCVEAILFDDATLDRVFGEIADFGLQHVRCEIPWGLIEPTQGVYDWAAFDDLMIQADKRGLTILPVTGIHNPSWKWTPGQFSEFAYRLAGRMWAPAYELGNEPNLHHFNAWASVKGPMDLLVAGSMGIRTAQEGARILFPGLAASVTFTQYLFPGFFFIPPGFPIYTNKSPEDFLAESLKIPGVSGAFDTMAYHPYSITPGFTIEHPSRSQMLAPRTAAIRQTLIAAKMPARANNLHLTEWGFDHAKIAPRDVLEQFKVQWAMTPMMEGPSGMSYFFCWRDYNGHGGSYGLVDANHVPRQPLYDHVKAVLNG